MVTLGISPEYFLDRMSIDEVVELLKADDNRRKEEWWQVRKQSFWSCKAMGAEFTEEVFNKKYFPLPWDKEKKPVKVLSKDDVKRKVKQVRKWVQIKR